MNKNIGKIIEIEWYDAQSIASPVVRPEDIEEMEAVKCKIVGYLIKEDKWQYIIAKEAWETNQYKYIHIIPKKMVENIRYY